MTDLAFRGALDLAAAIRGKELSSLELLEHLLERVARHNPRLNAVVALDEAGARERARAADDALARGEARGPFHGLPITIKDAFEVTGMPTTSGAPELAGHVPEANATAAQRLMDAGAVVFGKTNLPIYAGDLQSYNDVYGTTNNPWNLERVPGGSSGGAACALAAGLTPLELGSDIGGSIRNPSHHCGVYGHKPSWGIVPLRGHIPPGPGTRRTTDIGVAGPMARTPEDLAAALDVLAGADAGEGVGWKLELPAPRAERLADFRIGVWLDDARFPVDTEVGDVLQAAVDAAGKAGARIVARKPDLDSERTFETYLHLLYGQIAAGFPDVLLTGFDAAAGSLDPTDRGMNATTIRGASQRHREWLSMDEARHRLAESWAELFRDVDVLLCPITAVVAFPHDHSEFASRTLSVNGASIPYAEQIFWAGLTGVVGLPATAAPVGRSRSGLPVGIQIVGPRLEDRTPLRFASALAEVCGGFVPPPDFA